MLTNGTVPDNTLCCEPVSPAPPDAHPRVVFWRVKGAWLDLVSNDSNDDDTEFNEETVVIDTHPGTGGGSGHGGGGGSKSSAKKKGSTKNPKGTSTKKSGSKGSVKKKGSVKATLNPVEGTVGSHIKKKVMTKSEAEGLLQQRGSKKGDYIVRTSAKGNQVQCAQSRCYLRWRGAPRFI